MVSPILNEPIEFLGATVISMNATIGYGGNESSMSLELVEDCAKNQVFLPKINPNGYGVGSPVSIQINDFYFGGFLASWTENLGSNGYTISVRVNDPRSILENTAIVVDSLLNSPISSTNYVNVYSYYESNTLFTNSCSSFGISETANRGMPYNRIIAALADINPVVLTATGYPYVINWSTFIGSPTFNLSGIMVPQYYRIAGPSVSLMQLLQDVCNLLGLEFYVYVTNNYQINIGYVDLRSAPTSFQYIKDLYLGKATEISYGQELRNEKTKNLIIGEQQHYMSLTDTFDHFFGEDRYGTELVPVIPFSRNECGFWINKKIDSLNIQLEDPFPIDGPFWISEMDLRAAAASYNSWIARVMSDKVAYNDNPRTLNYAIAEKYPQGAQTYTNYLTTIEEGLKAGGNSTTIARGLPDALHAISGPFAQIAIPNTQKELELIHEWVKNLFDTYYGKQYITKLKQKVCVSNAIYGDPTSEKVYSDLPTGNGGWVDYGIPVLGLDEPELALFRQEDNRLSCFIRFDVEPIDGSGVIEDDDNNFQPSVPTGLGDYGWGIETQPTIPPNREDDYGPVVYA